jgi:hypothetical protein
MLGGVGSDALEAKADVCKLNDALRQHQNMVASAPAETMSGQKASPMLAAVGTKHPPPSDGEPHV